MRNIGTDNRFPILYQNGGYSPPYVARRNGSRRPFGGEASFFT
jgi:hypothetical protein